MVKTRVTVTEVCRELIGPCTGAHITQHEHATAIAPPGLALPELRLPARVNGGAGPGFPRPGPRRGRCGLGSKQTPGYACSPCV